MPILRTKLYLYLKLKETIFNYGNFLDELRKLDHWRNINNSPSQNSDKNFVFLKTI